MEATPDVGRLPSHVPSHVLGRYLREHYTAAVAGFELFERSARTQTEPQVRHELARLAAEYAENSAAMLGFLDELGVSRSPVGERMVKLGERLGRLKANGSLVRRSRLSDLLELEALCAALNAKKLAWL